MSVSKARLHKAKVSRSAKPKEVSVVPKLTKEDLIATLAVDYEMTNQRVKILQARMQKQIRPQIESAVENLGVEDISGHKHLDFGNVEMIHEKHASVVFNEAAAEAILAKKNLLDTVSHVETRRVMDEEKIVEAYEAGLITPKEFDKMFSEDVRWHFKVKINGEQVPEYTRLIDFRKRVESGEEELDLEEIEVSDG